MSSKLQLQQGARESEVCVSSVNVVIMDGLRIGKSNPDRIEEQPADGRRHWQTEQLLPDSIPLRSHWLSSPRIIHTVTFPFAVLHNPHIHKNSVIMLHCLY